MLRVVAHQSAAAARKYYSEGLRREDYYSEGQEVVGKWHGKAALRLGLRGDVTPETFAALVENRHPRTGERLTPRNKADRRVGYDLNFHAPKSLSVLHALTGDSDVLAAFRAAVKETMSELEERAAARMRRGGAKGNRTTGNLAWAEFIHFTARPVGGIPDPHLHIHCFAFNATFDSVEDRWKAVQFGDIKRDAPYAEAAFHARLTAKLAALGYSIRRTRNGWEVVGVPSSVIDKFSRRTAQIERFAKEHGITDAKTKDGLGAATREGKRHSLSYMDLLAAWSVRLTPEEKVAIAKARFDRKAHPPRETITAPTALDFAIEKLFTKHSVVEQRRLVAEALRYGVGQVKPEQIWRELARREMVVGKVGGDICCTTLDVLAEEVALIDFVRSGRGRCAPLNAGAVHIANEELGEEQRAAVRHLLSSHDQVIAIRGAAGVGKTTLMKEAAPHLQANGHKLFAFAPWAVASRETLRNEGFLGADTVAHLLLNKNLQKQVRGKVIWIDEAGLLGSREMWEVMKLAADGKTRIILTGDSQQHAPVARGDAFRLLQKYAGLPLVEVTEIRRQEHAIYKRAVSALSRGDLPSAFGDLDRLGAILEVPDDTARYRLLAADFVELSRKGSVPLVVSPTHAESARVTAAIRDARRDAGQIKAERSLIRYQNLQWENADKKRAENYREGLLVQFHQNAKGIRRGELFRILAAGEGSELMMRSTAGREIPVPLNVVERFQVFEPREITLGKGDLIRITNNGQSADGKRLNNGNVFAVEKFKKNGNIVLGNGAELRPDHGHFTHGYCQTSHSSQSKSVRDVLVAQSADSLVASSREQFYVSVSRGKNSIRIYTDDRRALQEAVGNTSARRSALELAGLKPRDISQMSDALNSKQWRDAIRSRLAEGKQNAHTRNLAKERKQNPNKKAAGMTWRQYVEMRRGLVGPDGRSRSKGHPQPKEKKSGNVAAKGRSFARPTELTTPTTERLKKAHEAKQRVAEPAKSKGAAQQNTRRNRLANAFQSAANHFNKLMQRRGEAKAAQPAALKAQPAMKAEPQKNKDVTPAKVPVPVSAPAVHQHRREQIIQSAQLKHKLAQAQAPRPLPQSNIQQVSDHAVRQKAAEAGKAQQEAAKLAQQPKQQPKPPTPTPPPPGPKK